MNPYEEMAIARALALTLTEVRAMPRDVYLVWAFLIRQKPEGA